MKKLFVKKEYERENGFTLIELLAVIAILAILVIVAIPTVLQLFKDAGKNTFKIEAQNIVKAAEQGYAKELFKGNVNETTITYVNGVQSKTGNISLNISGRKIQDGEIIISTAGKVSIAIYNGKYCATKTIDSDIITVEESSLEECVLIESTPEECFTFNSSTNTITGYDHDNENCPNDVIIPSFINGTIVENIGDSAFQEMYLDSVVIPDSIISIGQTAFGWNMFTKVIIPNSVTHLGDSAFACNQLTSVTISNNVTSIGLHTFSHNQLTSITIPDGVTYIGNAAFENNLLTNLTIPNSVTYIECAAFWNNQLTNVSFPNNLVTIGCASFENNYLTNITIPSSVTTIQGEAFFNNQLTSITMERNDTEIWNGFLTYDNNNFRDVYSVEGAGTYIGTQSGTWVKQ